MPALSKKLQIPVSALQCLADRVFVRFEPWLNQFINKTISDLDITGIFLILFYEDLYQEKWFEGFQKSQHLTPQAQSSIRIADILQKENTTKRIGKIAEMTLAEFFVNGRIHKLPYACQELMKAWCRSDLPIRVEFNILTPMAMLEEQIQGQRVVWLPHCKDDLTVYHEGKDPLQFVLHDLEHAYNFFVKFPLQEQIEFYKQLHGELISGIHDKRLQSDGHFRSEIEYLMSDMNSHPEHLRATLRALCVQEAY